MSEINEIDVKIKAERRMETEVLATKKAVCEDCLAYSVDDGLPECNQCFGNYECAIRLSTYFATVVS
jgi:hypothetical protein